MIINQNVKNIIKKSFYQFNNNPQLAGTYEKVIDELVDYLASIKQINSLDDFCNEIIVFLSQPRLRNLRDAMISEGKPLMNLGSIIYSKLDGGAIVNTEKGMSILEPITTRNLERDIDNYAKKLLRNNKTDEEDVVVITSDGREVKLSPERAEELAKEINRLGDEYVKASYETLSEMGIENTDDEKKSSSSKK